MIKRCTKKGYKDRKTAKRFMKWWNLRNEKKMNSVYYCTACQIYHLTSQDKSERKRIK